MESGEIGGYHETLLLDPPSIICTLCFRFPKLPKQCTVCKAVYCSSEIDPVAFECLVCTNKKTQELETVALNNYLNTTMFCSICSSVMIFQNYLKHACFLVPCWNSQICGKKDIEKSPFNDRGVCSPACLLVRMKKEKKGDKEMMGVIAELVKRYEFKGK